MNNDNMLILRDDRIVETIAKLQQRISDRFPGSGLSALCGQLHDVALQASERSAWISNPIRSIRIASYATAILLITLVIALVGYGLQHSDTAQMGFLEVVQVVEPGLNIVIFLAVAILFLVSLETRIKRQRAIAAVHELRSIAHVIDMHQLTKDPERVLRDWSATEHSPKQRMTPLQLNRYLDYCSEMLSMIGKIAALYIQQFDDPAAVAAVSEVEQLSTGLSRKIWQKIIATRLIEDSQSSRDPLGVGSSSVGTIEQDVDHFKTVVDEAKTVVETDETG